MDIVSLVERIGEAPTAALFGLITGITFGVAAQRSRFCLRAATVEFARGQMGDKVAVWLLTFSTALVWVQAAQLMIPSGCSFCSHVPIPPTFRRS